MKKIFLFLLLSLFCSLSFSQFPLHTVLPLGVSGIAFGDTLLNTRAVLQRAGIKKINTLQTSTDVASYWKAEYSIADGKITAMRNCFRRSAGSDSGFCLRDTVLYDSKERLQEYRAGDGKGTPYLECTLTYPEEGRVDYTWITKDPQRAVSDTDVYRHQYNGRGQLVRSEKISGRIMANNAWLYYNEDGLLDSISHDNPAWGTYVFKRKKRGKNKELAAETATAIYRWVSNAAGQCLSSYWSLKKAVRRRNQSVQPLYAEVDYTYNNDGTLAKVVEEKGGNKKTTTVYTYDK